MKCASISESWEQEPNNTFSGANGPLKSGSITYGLPNDQFDIFYFDAAAGSGNITLNGHTGNGVQLQLYYQDATSIQFVTYTTTAPFQISYSNLPAGRYWIAIYTSSGFNSTTPYMLTASYP
jgi:hypothetical protein